jgi:DNA-binding CsgD family transcriptional regulator
MMARGTDRNLPGYQRLTRREWDLINLGHTTTHRSAKALGIRPSTVVTMRASIRRKLGVWDRSVSWAEVISFLPQYPDRSL